MSLMLILVIGGVVLVALALQATVSVVEALTKRSSP